MPLLAPRAPERQDCRRAEPIFDGKAQFDYTPIDDTPGMLIPTQRVAVVDAMGELRSEHPAIADRLDAAEAEMPEIGDTFLGFQLVHELGCGAFGRVFLARQTSLADRLVALKVSADLNGESQRLAQLQHTNIVPIYSEHRSGNLHAVCMPYFGSTTLVDILKGLRSTQSLPTSGKHLLNTLVNRQSTVRGNSDASERVVKSLLDAASGSGMHPAMPTPLLNSSPATLSKIEKMSYTDAVLWVAARLADGLAHAHERGIIHRDLKPANILLCDDGQPMLLDFNLSEDVKQRAAMAVAQVGGTLPYMSPEQIAAFRDGRGSIDGRSDIYALGLILFHLLTGQHAFPVRKGAARVILAQMIRDRQGTPPSLRALNPSISPAVEAIVRHCIEPDLNRRYVSAAHIAEDIERHRGNLPLKYVKEPSLVERAIKWARRHPRLASPTSFAAMLAALMLIGVAVSVQLSLKQRAHDQEIRREEALNGYHDFLKDYGFAKDYLTTEDPAQIAEGLKYGEEALRHYNVFDQADWFEQPKVKELAPPDRARLKAEVGEVAFLLARAAHFQPAKDEADALRLNQLAEKNLDESAKAALVQQKADLAGKAIDAPELQRMRQLLENAAGLNARGRFLLACEHAARGRHREALTTVDAVVTQDPNDFGAWSLKARCHEMLDEKAEAIAAYGTAIALRPNYPRSYVSRAAIYYNQGKHYDQARQDLDQAIKLKPDLLEARVDRGLVLMQMRKYDQALVDLNWALEREDVPARVWFIRSRVHFAKGDKVGFKKDREVGMRTEPTDAVSWVSRGFARLEDDAAGALADFVKAEDLNPRSIDALHNQAVVLATKFQKPDEAIAALDRLLKQYPDNARAAGYRAVLLARTGKFDEAIAKARELLKQTPLPEHTYRAACVMALASEKQPALKNESLRLLARSLSRGYGHAQMEGDKDLIALRDTNEFKQFATLSRLMRVWSGPVVRE